MSGELFGNRTTDRHASFIDGGPGRRAACTTDMKRDPGIGYVDFSAYSRKEARRLIQLWVDGGEWDGEEDAPHSTEAACDLYQELSREAAIPQTELEAFEREQDHND